MKIATSTPATNAELESIAKGLSQSSEGFTEPRGSSTYTFQNATAQNNARVKSSTDSRIAWLRAEISMHADPRHQGDEQHTEDGHPERVGRQALGAEEEKRVLPGDLHQARHHHDVRDDDGPPAHPACVWPHARVTQQNVVPQSESWSRSPPCSPARIVTDTRARDSL
jgi:hypothetical protein